MDENFRHSIKLDNDPKMVVMGKGNVPLNINEITHAISNVYYNNLLLIGQLQRKKKLAIWMEM